MRFSMLFRSLGGGEEHLPAFSPTLFGDDGAGDPAGEPREPREPAGEHGLGEDAAGPGELLPLLLLLPTEFFG